MPVFVQSAEAKQQPSPTNKVREPRKKICSKDAPSQNLNSQSVVTNPPTLFGCVPVGEGLVHKCLVLLRQFMLSKMLLKAYLVTFDAG